jgi:anti-anti-sigma factor
MELRIRDAGTGRGLVISANGAITAANAHELQIAILLALAGADELSLDLQAVSTIDSVGANVLVTARRQVEANGGTFRLVGVGPNCF